MKKTVVTLATLSLLMMMSNFSLSAAPTPTLETPQKEMKKTGGGTGGGRRQ